MTPWKHSFWITPSSSMSEELFSIIERVFYNMFLILSLVPISVWPTQPFGPRPPLGGKKIFQKEQPVMVKKPSLSIHIELYIIYPFPNNKYWRTFFSFFHLRKVILPDFSLLGFKRKRICIWKRKNFLGRRKKSLLVRPWTKSNKKYWPQPSAAMSWSYLNPSKF